MVVGNDGYGYYTLYYTICLRLSQRIIFVNPAIIRGRNCETDVWNGCLGQVQEAVNGLTYDLSRIPDSPIDCPCQKSAVRRKIISVFYTIYTHNAFTAFFFCVIL